MIKRIRAKEWGGRMVGNRWLLRHKEKNLASN